MTLVKHHVYISIAILIVAVVAFFLFWKKKKETFNDTKDDVTLVLYYSPECGHCHRFMNGKENDQSEWSKIKHHFHKKIKIHEVNCKNEDCVDIPGYPTLVLIKNKQRIFFNDQRTVENIIKFIDKNL